MSLSERKAFHPEPISKFDESTFVIFLASILLGWLALPLVHNAVGAVLFFSLIGFLILVARIINQSAAIWVVVGIVIGIIVDLLFQTSSSALGGDGLLRAFFVLYLVMIV